MGVSNIGACGLRHLTESVSRIGGQAPVGVVGEKLVSIAVRVGDNLSLGVSHFGDISVYIVFVSPASA